MTILHWRRCLKTFYIYDMDVVCSLKGFTASTQAQAYDLHTYITQDFGQLTQIWGNVCALPVSERLYYAHLQHLKVLKHLVHMYCMNVACSLKGFTVATIMGWHAFHTYIINKDFNQLYHIWETVCCGNVVSVHPYDHTQLEKVLKHLLYVCYGCGMQFERFYSLTHSLVA